MIQKKFSEQISNRKTGVVESKNDRATPGFFLMRYMLFSDGFPAPFLDFVKCQICSFHFLCDQ